MAAVAARALLLCVDSTSPIAVKTDSIAATVARRMSAHAEQQHRIVIQPHARRRTMAMDSARTTSSSEGSEHGAATLLHPFVCCV